MTLSLRLTNSFPDHLISELDTRFDGTSSQNITQFMQLLPSAVAKESSTSHSFDTLLEFYEGDLTLTSFDSEFHLWKHKWTNESQLNCFQT